jgi:hypothetical protein
MSNERRDSILVSSMNYSNDVSKNISGSFLRRTSTKTDDIRQPSIVKVNKSKGKTKASQVQVVNKSSKRTDVFGNDVVKGLKVKSFKVTFRDKTSDQSLTDVVQVNSYKKHYNEDSDDEGKVSVNCGCNIF